MKDLTASLSTTRKRRWRRAARRCSLLILGTALRGFAHLASANQDRELALGALQRLDYNGAAAILSHLADAGDPHAQAALSTLIESKMIEPDYPLPPVELLRKAADQGLPQAARELGNRNHLGRELVRDLEQAVDWWRIAAENGSIAAAFNLGLAYAKGTGTPTDLK